MFRRFRKWQALPKAERKALLSMMLAMPFLELALRLFGYGRTRRWIERRTQHSAARAAIEPDAMGGERVAQLATIAGNHGLIHATCLRQSLLVYGLLRWRGLTPDLVIGVQRTSPTPDMHAWVILNGVPLAQDTLQPVPFPIHSNGRCHSALSAEQEGSPGDEIP